MARGIVVADPRLNDVDKRPADVRLGRPSLGLTIRRSSVHNAVMERQSESSSMKRFLRGVLSGLASAVSLIGIIGVPEDLRKWNCILREIGNYVDQHAVIRIVCGFVLVGVGFQCWLALSSWLSLRQKAASKGHGLPTKRRLEAQWRQEIEQLIEMASGVGRSVRKATEWRDAVIETFENFLVRPSQDRRTFRKRVKSIAKGKDISTAVDKGVSYLRAIQNKDGGELR